MRMLSRSLTDCKSLFLNIMIQDIMALNHHPFKQVSSHPTLKPGPKQKWWRSEDFASYPWICTNPWHWAAGRQVYRDTKHPRSALKRKSRKFLVKYSRSSFSECRVIVSFHKIRPDKSRIDQWANWSRPNLYQLSHQYRIRPSTSHYLQLKLPDDQYWRVHYPQCKQ